MLRISFVLLISLLTGLQVLKAQNKSTISGYVVDARSGESIPGALITDLNSRQQVQSNNYGFYSIQVTKGPQNIQATFVGKQTETFSFYLTADTTIRMLLSAQSNQLNEVQITGKRSDVQLFQTQAGAVKMDMQQLAKMPVLFGEKDVLKTIQLLPGVASGGEGSTSFYVRGGAGDQNLILLDEAIVYNSSHLFGFFSTFNADAIKNVTFYKAGVPANFGGRISSVLDVAMQDGNNQQFTAEGGVGLIASRLKLDIPVIKNKSSLMLSGRRTYADMFLKLSKNEDIKNSQLYFYDLNAKWNYKINDKNTVFASGYFGNDVMGYHNTFRFRWGNATGTMRWNHVWNNKLFSNTSVIFSRFNYRVAIEKDNNFEINSNIFSRHAKQDFQYFLSNQHTLRFGAEALFQEIKPASITANDNSSVNNLSFEKRKGVDLSAYLSHEWKISPKVLLYSGLRANEFLMPGPATVYHFDNNGNAIDTLSYGKHAVVQRYFYLEPRVSLNYQLKEDNVIKLAYNRTVQSIHQLSNTTSSLPTDQYILSSNLIKPQVADQYSISYSRDLAEKKYEASFDLYYKNLRHQIDYKDGADLQANEQIESQLLFGKGRAYGAEWYLRKNGGRLTGWLSYSLSKSERQFEKINNGNWFNARQDRTHNLALVGILEWNKKWSLSGSFVFYTGNAVTMPSAKYEINGETIFYYSQRNAYRMPNYHRFDLAATYTPQPQKRWRSSWSFGLYNVYNRKNAYLIDFRSKDHNPNQIEIYRIALFGVVPSVTWNFKF